MNTFIILQYPSSIHNNLTTAETTHNVVFTILLPFKYSLFLDYHLWLDWLSTWKFLLNDTDFFFLQNHVGQHRISVMKKKYIVQDSIVKYIDER